MAADVLILIDQQKAMAHPKWDDHGVGGFVARRPSGGGHLPILCA